jgi:hypothetical protein
MERLLAYCKAPKPTIAVFNREEDRRLTLLVDTLLPKTNPSLNEFGEVVSQMESHCYALKWTDSLELASTRLLSQFAASLEFVTIPKMTATLPNGIDLASKCTQVSEPVLQPLHAALNNIFSCFTKQTTKSDTCVMRSQKIQAKDLEDFFANGYKNLDQEEKDSFFRRLGRIAYLDFALGFTDRLLQIGLNDMVEDDLETDLLDSANLDNILVMTQAGTKGVSFYLIDNALNASFIEHPEPYKKLLKEQLSLEDFDQQFADKVLNALLSTLRDSAKTQSVAKELRQNKDSILDQLAKGIGKMDALFPEIVTSCFPPDSPHEHLKALHPKIVETISDRIDAIRIAKASRYSPARIRPRSTSALSSHDVVEIIARNLTTPTSPEMQRTVIPCRDENSQIEAIFFLTNQLRNQGLDEKSLQQLRELLSQLGHLLPPVVPPPTPMKNGDSTPTPPFMVPLAITDSFDGRSTSPTDLILSTSLPRKPTPKK